MQVIRLLVQGLSNAEMAREMRISVRTVESHTTNIRRKFGVTNRTGIVMAALSAGIATVAPPRTVRIAGTPRVGKRRD